MIHKPIKMCKRFQKILACFKRFYVVVFCDTVFFLLKNYNSSSLFTFSEPALDKVLLEKVHKEKRHSTLNKKTDKKMRARLAP